ncbi:hypothetical protein [Mycobacterium leprae]|uniref:hypothetical protein n=1 Tax=Mycobacterium leprae TaxID=1769 RepID=UPI000A7B4627|nr:hypothetical protein [Mycobacterium leprae]
MDIGVIKIWNGAAVPDVSAQHFLVFWPQMYYLLMALLGGMEVWAKPDSKVLAFVGEGELMRNS